MKIKLKTLTPIWTGGVDGKVDRIHETSIIGSLRWWYEVIVRGLGGHACDPSKHECTLDVEEYHKSNANDERQRLHDAGLCDVCQVFGATGWRRRFRLKIEETSISDASITHPIRANRTYKRKVNNGEKECTPTWYFADPTRVNQRPTPANVPKEGEFVIDIQNLAYDFPSKEVIAGLIQFIADWAALGARPQIGFGVVDLVDGRINAKSSYKWVTAVAGNHQYNDLPSLRNMFFARIVPKNGSSFSEEEEKETFNLKYDLRRLFPNDQKLRHFIMGTVEEERMAAKVSMSRPYEHKEKSTIRVWGWIPQKAKQYQNGWDREKVVNSIHNHLESNYCLEVWREMNSSRDTGTPNNNAVAFLRSLLGLEEGSNAV